MEVTPDRQKHIPLVSVVITAYQKAQFLSRALRSVLDQTCSDLEVIVVDDGSTDNTREIVESFANDDSRISYIYQANQGPGGARNTGIRGANSDLIALLDGDDAWLPNKLEYQTRVMRLHSEIDLLLMNTLYVDTQTDKLNKLDSKYIARYFNLREIGQDLYFIEDRDFPSKILQKNPFIPSTVIFRRYVATALGGFNEQLRGPEDLDFWVRAASKNFRFAYANQIGITYYKNASSLVQPSEVTYLEQLRHALYAFDAPEYGPLQEAVQRLIQKRYRQLVVLYTFQSRPEKAWQMFRQSTRYGKSFRTFLIAATSFIGPAPLTAYSKFRRLTLPRN